MTKESFRRSLIIEMDNINKENKFKNFFTGFQKYIFENKILTVPVIALIIAGIVSVVVWRLSIAYVAVADFCAGTISFAVRFVLTKITYLLPFSFAEILLFASVPLVLFLLVRFILKIVRAKRNGKTKPAVIFRGIFRLVAFCGLIMFVFTFAFGVCYGTTPLNQKIGFERRLLDTDDLSAAMEILIDEANEVAGNLTHLDFEDENGSTVMPYDINELNKKLNEAYKNMLAKHGLFRRINSKVKPVMLSEEMTKMHITGIYVPFTGEANVNVHFSDYNLPFTSAHEMSHLMGVGREDEANFAAFLVCIHSGDDYIRYSGLLNMLEYIGNALYKTDSGRYYEIMWESPRIVLQETAAFSRFFDKYRYTKISKVSNAVNNTYLQAQGQKQGAQSYGFVVDLATVYLIDIYEK